MSWKGGDAFRFSPEAKNVRTDFRDRDLIVRSVSKDGSRISFSPKGSKKDAKTNSTTSDRIVRVGGGGSEPPSDSNVYHQMVEKFGLLSNDIFFTPQVVFQYMSAMLGYDVSQCFDPCPGDLRHGEDWDALLPAAKWQSPAFCNPPFSQTFFKLLKDGGKLPGFLEKAVQQAEQGVEVVMLIGYADYFMQDGKERCALWADWRKRVHIELLSCSDTVAGLCHKWFRWGPNMVTGKATGGSMFGVTIFRILPTRPPGESMLMAPPEATKVIEDHKSKRGTAPAKTQLPLPITISEGVELKILELFSGTGSVGKVAEQITNCRVISVDINQTTAGYKPTLVCDILDLDYARLGFVPDIIWASPPCQTYSGFAAGKHRTKDDMTPKTADGKRGKKILQRTVEIISHFEDLNPSLVFYMENPHGGTMKYEQEVLRDLPMSKMVVVSYCRYGFQYKKDTDIWTNDRAWIKKAKRCSTETPCEYQVDGRHVQGVKDRSKTGQAQGPKTIEERYQIPEQLIREIFEPYLDEQIASQEQEVERLSQELDDISIGGATPDLSFSEFAVTLEVRLQHYMNSTPDLIDPRIAGMRLCNADRRTDRTTLCVINEILAKKDGHDMLIDLALMRCGPNEPDRFLELRNLIDQVGPGEIDAWVEHTDTPFPRSYRRPLQMATDRTQKYIGYAEGAYECWQNLLASESSQQSFGIVLDWLGGTAPFSAYQICLDIGYKHPEIYNEDVHFVVGPGAKDALHVLAPGVGDERAQLTALRDDLQHKMRMKVTLQTVEGLLCEFRKYQQGKRLRPVSPCSPEYVALHKLAVDWMRRRVHGLDKMPTGTVAPLRQLFDNAGTQAQAASSARAQEMASAGGAEREERFRKQQLYAVRKAAQRQKFLTIRHEAEVGELRQQMKQMLSANHGVTVAEPAEEPDGYTTVVRGGYSYLVKDSDDY